jgi:hypothetical protein
METQKVKWTCADGKWTSISETILGIESQDQDSKEIKLKVKYPKDIKSSDIDFEDKQIYEGNFENVSTITQSEIRIFLSSTFKGKIIYIN